MDKEFYEKLFYAVNRYIYLHNERVSININKEIALRVTPQLTHNQHHIVLKIYNEGPVQISTIQRVFTLPSSNATRLANELIAKGLCKKSKISGKRGVFLSLSEEGENFVKQKSQCAKDYTPELYSTYLTDEEQQEWLNHLLRINEIVSKLPEP